MIVVGDLIGKIRELRFETRLLAIDESFPDVPEQDRVVVRAVFENAFAAFESQIQAVEFGVMLFELVDHAQRLQIMFEAAEVAHALVQGILPGVSERRMAKIMGETDGLGQFLVELQRARSGSGYLRDLERMGQPRSVQIALVVDEDLGLVDQPAKCGGMNDAIAVALIFRAVFGLGLGMAAAAGMFRMSGIGREALMGTRSFAPRSFGAPVICLVI